MPIVGTRVSDHMMVLACQLATEKKSSIAGLYVIEVPLNLPLDARLTRERAKADQVLKAAALIASQFKVTFTPHIVAARHAGRAIVDEAGVLRSEVIVLGTMRKRRIADRVFGRTSDYVHRPCTVRGSAQPRPQFLCLGGLRASQWRGQRFRRPSVHRGSRRPLDDQVRGDLCMS